MFQIAIRAHFDAAHFLRNYPGKCSRIHGHRWEVEVCLKGNELSSTGMLVDFQDLKQAVNQTIAAYDHNLLNELPEFSQENFNPTAENIARQIFLEVKNTLEFERPICLAWVKVYESPDAWALYKEDL
ncbi:MAG: 6-carboxytetrahydropterin synthase QueD [Desulfitobacteriaceae bacterium]